MDLGLDGARALDRRWFRRARRGRRHGPGRRGSAGRAGGPAVGPPRDAVAPDRRARSRSAPTSRAPTARPPPSRRAVDAFGGLDLLLVNSGGPPPGDVRRARRGRLGTAPSTAPCAARSGSSARRCRTFATATGRRSWSILSSSAREPIPGLTASNLLRPGLAGLDQVAHRRDRPDPDQRPRARAGRDGPYRRDRGAAAERTGATTEEVRAATIARIPLGRYGDPAEVGRLGAFLLSPAASYVTGAIVPIDGGMVQELCP